MTILERSRPAPSRWRARLRDAVARAGLRANLRDWGRELALVAIGALAYYLIRGGVVDRAEEAFARGADLIELERRLGIFWEPAMQDWILGSRALIDLSNAVYFWGHMPLIVVIGVWLFWRKRGVYRLTRNAFLGSAVVALICYAALPVAPPRFFPELGFVDTMALYSQASYQAQEVRLFVNPYAALPSLHFGWALLLGLALWLARPGGRSGLGLRAGGAADPAGAGRLDRADGQPLPPRRRGGRRRGRAGARDRAALAAMAAVWQSDGRQRSDRMLTTTSDDVPGREIAETLGLVTANTVRSRHVGRDILAGLKTIVGGEIGAYTQLLTESRAQALSQLEAEAGPWAPTRSSGCA